MTQKKFIIVTKDYSGLGYAQLFKRQGAEVLLAVRLDSESEDEDMKKAEKLIGKGLVDKVYLDDLWKERSKYKDWYWLFDQNHYYKEGEQLRKEGFKRVWGGLELQYKMEHDREFGVALVKKAGMSTPETVEFTTPEEGMQFLDENEEKAYVFKPNEQSAGWDTYVPDSEKDVAANNELHAYIDSLPAGNTGGYILQERIKGIEANFEIWLYEGKPFYACCDLECKKKNNDDFGGLCGGSQDIGFSVNLDAKGVRETVGKLLVLPEFKNYTGFVDANVIIADNGGYFLEFCARMGYPAHVSLFYALCKTPAVEIFADMMDGKVDDFYHHFKYGFCAGITLYNDRPRKGLPLYIPEDLEDKFFAYDTYKRGDLTMMAGSGEEVGVITGHGFSTIDAAEDVIANGKKIAFPNRAMRTDLDRDSYNSNPRDRYLALEAMQYLIS